MGTRNRKAVQNNKYYNNKKKKPNEIFINTFLSKNRVMSRVSGIGSIWKNFVLRMARKSLNVLRLRTLFGLFNFYFSVTDKSLQTKRASGANTKFQSWYLWCVNSNDNSQSNVIKEWKGRHTTQKRDIPSHSYLMHQYGVSIVTVK